jgi:spore coat protein U-like protein
MKKLILTALTLALVTIAPAAFAGTASGTLTVTAGVAANCTIASSATLAFGAYDPIVGAALDGQTTMAVACTKGFDPIITIPLAGRVMNTSPVVDPLNYLLFSDSGRTNSFGETLGTGFHMGAAPGKAARNVTIYGRIVGGQDVSVGAYSGTIQVTVNF